MELLDRILTYLIAFSFYLIPVGLFLLVALRPVKHKVCNGKFVADPNNPYRRQCAGCGQKQSVYKYSGGRTVWEDDL